MKTERTKRKDNVDVIRNKVKDDMKSMKSETCRAAKCTICLARCRELI